MSWCGGGRDEPHARRGVPRLGDPRVHLVAGQLTALTGLGTLRHLDLQVVSVGRGTPTGDAEAARLATCLMDERLESPLDIGTNRSGILATLSGVGLGTDPVHGDGQRLVGLGADGAVAHGTGGEPLDDLARWAPPRRWTPRADSTRACRLEQPAQRGEVLSTGR